MSTPGTARIEMTVLGLPMAQARHRSFRRKTGNPINVDPHLEAKRDFLTIIQKLAPYPAWDCACRLTLRFYFRRPDSHFWGNNRTRPLHPHRAETFYCPKGKHDVDNLAKFVMDAINGIFYSDDGRIAILQVAKLYDLQPRTEIILEQLENEQLKGVSHGSSTEQYEFGFCERLG